MNTTSELSNQSQSNPLSEGRDQMRTSERQRASVQTRAACPGNATNSVRDEMRASERRRAPRPDAACVAGER